MKWLYLALDLAALIGPVALSFDQRVAFHRNYRCWFPAILCMMLVFVPWDMAFVAAEIWGFGARYVSGVYLGNLPIKEWLFSPVVSYACLFIYECLRYYSSNNPLERWHRPILLGFAQSAVALPATNVEEASARLRSLYREDLHYENPIQRVEGIDAFLRLMRHMATRWSPFSMQIDEGLESPDRVLGRFRLAFRRTFLRRTLEIEGLTRCVVANGRIIEQRDDGDAMSSALDAVPLAGPV